MIDQPPDRSHSLQFTGSAAFNASPEEVWAFLIDPSRLGPCSPVPIERVDERHFHAQARLGSGFFSATVRLDLEIADVLDGQRARITGRGSASGTTVSASLALEIRTGSPDGTTTVDWDLDAQVSGMFAGQAERAIGDRAQDAIQRLVDCIRRQVDDGP